MSLFIQQNCPPSPSPRNLDELAATEAYDQGRGANNPPYRSVGERQAEQGSRIKSRVARASHSEISEPEEQLLLIDLLARCSPAEPCNGINKGLERLRSSHMRREEKEAPLENT